MLEGLAGVRREWLRGDLVAGLTSAAVVIPKAMAYAAVAGLPVQVGLYTAFVPMVVYAVLGTSRVLSVSTTTTIAILTAANLGQLAPGGDAEALLRASATLSLLVGAFLVLGSLLRLGFLANFISEPVLVGFKAGIGVVIVLDQLPKLLGVHYAKGTFVENLVSLVQSLPETSPASLVLGLLAVAVMLGADRFVPRAPGPLVAIGLGVVGMAFFGLAERGVETIGAVPAGLPSPTWPDRALVAALWPGAVGIALMSFTETIAAARAFAASGEPLLRPNRELLATGVATAGGALLGAMSAGGGTSQTAVNRLSGARSQVAGLVTAGVTLLTMLFLAPLMSSIPQAVLAAVVIVYSVGLIHPLEFRAIRTIRRTEFLWALAAFAGVMLLGTLRGIVAAIVLSLVSLSQQAADPAVIELGRRRGSNVFRPRSPEHPDDETWPGLLMARVVGRLFFASYQRVFDKVRALVEAQQPRVVALDLGGVMDVEYTALKMLAEAEGRMRERGIALWLVGLNPGVREVVERSPLGKTLGRERLFHNLEQAVEAYGRMAPAEPAAPVGPARE
jgi:SulP family sulfate permease